jgi:hypothetical protein
MVCAIFRCPSDCQHGPRDRWQWTSNGTRSWERVRFWPSQSGGERVHPLNAFVKALDLGWSEQALDLTDETITAKRLTVEERERLLRQARKVLEKATATRVDIAGAIGEAIRRRRVAPVN